MQTESEGLWAPTFMDITVYSLVSKKVLEFIGLAQWSPIFWAPGISFVEDNFSTNRGKGMGIVSRWFSQGACSLNLSHEEFSVEFVLLWESKAIADLIGGRPQVVMRVSNVEWL